MKNHNRPLNERFDQGLSGITLVAVLERGHRKAWQPQYCHGQSPTLRLSLFALPLLPTRTQANSLLHPDLAVHDIHLQRSSFMAISSCFLRLPDHFQYSVGDFSYACSANNRNTGQQAPCHGLPSPYFAEILRIPAAKSARQRFSRENQRP